MVILALLPAHARTQPLEEPPAITPDLALLAAQQAYATARTAERMQIRIGDRARSWLIVKIAPGRAFDLSDALIAAELGDLRLFIEDGSLIAANTRAPGVYYQQELLGVSQSAIAESLPPIPLPQLALARPWRDGADLTPYTTNVHWTAAAWDDEAGVVRIDGASDQGRVTLELDRTSGRLHRTRAETEAGSLEITAEPIDPGDPVDWRIDTTGLERVERLSDLTARARPLTVGDRFPDLPTLTTTGEVRPVEALLSRGPGEWTQEPHRRLILILAPLGPAATDDEAAAPPDPEVAVRAFLAAVAEVADQADTDESDLPPFAAYLALFIRTGGFEQEAAAAAAAAWKVPPERILWSPLEMPRFEGVEPSRPVAVVLDPARTVLSIITPASAGEAPDAADLATRLRQALMPPVRPDD